MAVLLVVENPKNWKLHIPGAEVVPAREYVADPRFAEIRRAKVFNFCRAYSYQSLGYYDQHTVTFAKWLDGRDPTP